MNRSNQPPKYDTRAMLLGLLFMTLHAFADDHPHARVPQGTALDRYVYAPDAHYSYRLVKTLKAEQASIHVLEMTSQQWLSETEVDRPVWKHWLNVIVPRNVLTDTALLFIGGGKNGGEAPNTSDARMVQIAHTTGSVVVELKMIPNQPLVFKDEGLPRSEDALIAYTWNKYLRTGESRWLARLPMTKAAVRAMDTVTAFCAGDKAGQVSVRQFVVAGGSKRGWTTWTTGAVDKRVRAIFPIVIDMLNVIPSFKHHFDAYGFYAPAVGDYESMGIMEWQDTQEYQALTKIVDPFEYRDRMTMPKFIINACGDQFFLPDSWRFYYDELKGVKNLRYVPNGEHSLRDTDAYETLLAAYLFILHDLPIPSINWHSSSPGHVEASVSGIAPESVKLWQAENPDARDFRVDTIGRTWTSRDLTPAGGDEMSYEVVVEAPEKGWKAFMMEFTFQADKMPVPLKMTTGVYITPDTLPHKGKAGNL
ncbi:PhoPQ-activated pathogenicity-related family protein [bacterium]|nr:PhoPQ-activated pathogenicity-related family protein [bacterium]